jgi:hypothetical protein
MRGSTLFLVSLVGGVACGGESTRTSGDGASNGGSSAGTVQGGQATGGSSASGASGSGQTGGTSGASQTGGAMPTGGSPNPPRDGICTTVTDCTLSTDCCSCFAAGPGEATATFVGRALRKRRPARSKR